MIKPSDLYDKTKLPVDEHLLDKLIERYLSISYAKMSNSFMELSKLLYNSINITNENQTTSFNKEDLNQLISVINEDFVNAGRPYDPQKYNGVKNPLGLMPGWTIFQSWHLLGTEKIESKDIAHRFYFGISNGLLRVWHILFVFLLLLIFKSMFCNK